MTFPSLPYLPEPVAQWRYTGKPFLRGLQLQVQLRILTVFPFHRSGIGHQMTLFWRQRYNFFRLTTHI